MQKLFIDMVKRSDGKGFFLSIHSTFIRWLTGWLVGSCVYRERRCYRMQAKNHFPCVLHKIMTTRISSLAHSKPFWHHPIAKLFTRTKETRFQSRAHIIKFKVNSGVSIEAKIEMFSQQAYLWAGVLLLF